MSIYSKECREKPGTETRFYVYLAIIARYLKNYVKQTHGHGHGHGHGQCKAIKQWKWQQWVGYGTQELNKRGS